jgi:hypothetical protein
MKKIFLLFILLSSLFNCLPAKAQEKDLGDKEYIIVKDYKPVLAESVKISDLPDADSSSSTPSVLSYKIAPKKIETNYEAGVIKAVKLKDEPISKLYRNLVKLGIGNYSTYYGELFSNSIRSKKGSLGLHLKHFSASPKLSDVGDADFSENEAGLYGKYFLENSTFTGDVNYFRDVVHYYGYDINDPILRAVNMTEPKQRFNNFALNLGLLSNYMSTGHLDYDVRFHFNSINDLYDVSENDFIVSGTLGKMVDENYFSLPVSFDYFKKTDASYQQLSLNSNLGRSIISLSPQVKIDKDNFHLMFGLGIDMEKNLSTLIHLFPRAEISIPIAEHILTAFAGVDGNIEKNNFKTITDENPYTTSAVIPENTIHQLIIRGGLKGNFSNTISFNASVNFDQLKDMQYFYNDTSFYTSKFNTLYDNTDVLNLHAEISYMQSEKLNISLHVDQNSYSPDTESKAWHKPNSIVSIVAKYNLNDKVFADVSLFGRGPQYARFMSGGFVVAQKLNGYVDANLGLEYRYSKILSVYVHLNNLGFSRYYRWALYPSEEFNVMGGLTYAF